MKKVLVTGGAGFIGSNFVQHMLNKQKDILLVNLDMLTYAGNLENLKAVEDDPRYVFVKGDVRDKELVESCLQSISLIRSSTSLLNPMWIAALLSLRFS